MNICQLPEAVWILRQGGIIAYPTEAVFGLGCDPRNEAATLRLLALKQRPIDKGLILVAAEFAQLSAWLLPMSEDLRIQVTASWPGPTTWLLPAAAHVPKYLCGAHDTLAVRVSAHPIVRELCLAFGGPLVSTSANKANQAPARDAQQVKEMFAEQIDGLLDGSLGGQEQPTEIRDGRTGQIIRSSNSL